MVCMSSEFTMFSVLTKLSQIQQLFMCPLTTRRHARHQYNNNHSICLFILLHIYCSHESSVAQIPLATHQCCPKLLSRMFIVHSHVCYSLHTYSINTQGNIIRLTSQHISVAIPLAVAGHRTLYHVIDRHRNKPDHYQYCCYR